jgi:hypothetical protein
LQEQIEEVWHVLKGVNLLLKYVLLRHQLRRYRREHKPFSHWRNLTQFNVKALSINWFNAPVTSSHDTRSAYFWVKRMEEVGWHVLSYMKLHELTGQLKHIK